MFNRILLLTLVSALLIPIAAQADLYIGASVGNSWFSYTPQIEDVKKINENSTGYKLFGGYQGDGFLGVEGGYRDLGKVKYMDTNHEFSSKTTGWDVEAVGRIQIAIIKVFAKAGAFFWETDMADYAVTDDSSGTDFIWGLGAGINLGPVGVRLEWESMEVQQPDGLTMLSLGATLGF